MVFQIDFNAALKGKIKANIRDQVLTIYRNIEIVEYTHEQLEEILHPDNRLHAEGSEVYLLRYLDQRLSNCMKAVDYLGELMDKYTLRIDDYDDLNVQETSRIIEKLQEELPEHIVEPSELATLVIAKLETTGASLRQAHELKVATEAFLEEEEE